MGSSELSSPNRGAPLMFQPPTPAVSQKVYDDIVNSTGCSNAKDSLSCLRQVPAGEILPRRQRERVRTASFSPWWTETSWWNGRLWRWPGGTSSKCCLLIRANTAEGSMFATMGVDNDTAMHQEVAFIFDHEAGLGYFPPPFAPACPNPPTTTWPN